MAFASYEAPTVSGIDTAGGKTSAQRLAASQPARLVLPLFGAALMAQTVDVWTSFDAQPSYKHPPYVTPPFSKILME
jgi:hypothetical protein